MRFTLTYTGELKANARPQHKHDLRREFHKQLRVLWQQPPLAAHNHWFTPGLRKTPIDLNRRVPPYRFVPLVSPSIFLVCELRIFLLRPEPPGAIITQGGDIDNRLKTLFDALRVPKDKGELPSQAAPAPDEDPFFCLLEDDALIIGVSVETDRLLADSQSATWAHLDIQVITRATEVIQGNRLVGNLGLM